MARSGVGRRGERGVALVGGGRRGGKNEKTAAAASSSPVARAPESAAVHVVPVSGAFAYRCSVGPRRRRTQPPQHQSRSRVLTSSSLPSADGSPGQPYPRAHYAPTAEARTVVTRQPAVRRNALTINDVIPSAKGRKHCQRDRRDPTATHFSTASTSSSSHPKNPR